MTDKATVASVDVANAVSMLVTDDASLLDMDADDVMVVVDDVVFEVLLRTMILAACVVLVVASVGCLTLPDRLYKIE